MSECFQEFCQPLFLLCVYVGVLPAWNSVYHSMQCCRGWKTASPGTVVKDSCELPTMWVLGLELASSGTATRALNWAISQPCVCPLPACLVQKRAPDPLELALESPYGCWELSSGLLQDEQVLLTAGPALRLWHVTLTSQWSIRF